ncbi:DUF3455 domain-containing protein [Hydrogenophaga sp.]|uniref:DUF3455 domain-containing protein n=1 Tax=Hydrogenophaga sp. TaxID=1904254 RepID=UPI003F6E575F
MNTSKFLKPLAVLWAGACLAAVAACAGAPITQPKVPAALEPGGSVRTLATISATGVQIYECRMASGSNAAAWTFVAPEAQLFDERGRSMGTHGAGPYWMGLDGSRVVGSVRARADAPESGAIPWLLLTTQNVGAPGVLSAVSFIQRLNTEGGIAPVTGCDAQSIGRQVRVGYRADYRLFVPA